MDNEDHIAAWCRFKCGNTWEGRRAWEFVQLHGDPFDFFNLPSGRVPICSLRCKRCRAKLDIDFSVIRNAQVYDYDCEHCYACNCFSSVAEITKLDRFREQCEKWQRAWDTRVYGREQNDDDFEPRTRRTRSGVSAKLRWRVLHRDGFKCRYCGAGPGEKELHVDHVRSKANGGADILENLVTACIPCNLGKGSESVQQPLEIRYLPSMNG